MVSFLSTLPLFSMIHFKKKGSCSNILGAEHFLLLPGDPADV